MVTIRSAAVACLLDFITAPAAYAAGGTTSLSLVRRGRQRGRGPTSPNGAPASAQPIAFASSRTARRYFRISSARACSVASGIYQPLLREQRRSHGRKITVTPPLFPGYLFVWVVRGWWMHDGPRACGA